ncbi:MAG: ribosomal-protein-alanine N-acetyltransferase [Maribacter sp.]|jgi:ribosomal-protein-alanine N-acetyltransferase
MQAKFPILETERLILRAFKETDVKNIFATYSEDEVTKYYDLESMKSENEAIEITEVFKTRFENGIGIRWAIELKETREYIGDCGYNPWSKTNRKAEIGYALISKYWGKGYAIEAIKSILHYGFRELDIVKLNKIMAMIDPRNEKSIQLVEKLGFQHEGTLKEHVLEKGVFVDMAVYAILEKEYKL